MHERVGIEVPISNPDLQSGIRECATRQHLRTQPALRLLVEDLDYGFTLLLDHHHNEANRGYPSEIDRCIAYEPDSPCPLLWICKVLNQGGH
jgi:hypothetical protein